MRSIVQALARELGFDACRVTTASTPESAAHFERWLEEGCHGEMAYLQRNADKRIHPQSVLAGAKSIITLAASYGSPEPISRRHPGTSIAADFPGIQETPRAPHGVIARYARYSDYHDVLNERLRSLTEKLKELGGPETKSLSYVDTGPLLERDIAQRAGIGFVGKHTNLIGRQLGNWFFLAEIITTVPLAPDLPEKNRCGSCVRCLTACPTQAITRPFHLDARRCISYLTIELKGPIPVQFRRAIGNRIFGCDDCLEACPWNRFARAAKLMQPHARPDLQQPELFELLRLDDAAFKSRFRGTPVERSKRRGLLRNVCVALGNVGNSSALPALEAAAQDCEPLIAEHAVWALSEIRSRLSPINHVNL